VYIYIYTYVRANICCVYICIYMCVFVYMYGYICVHIHGYIQISTVRASALSPMASFMHIYKYVYVCVCIYTYTCIYICCIYVCIHMFGYTYVHMYISMYIREYLCLHQRACVLVYLAIRDGLFPRGASICQRVGDGRKIHSRFVSDSEACKNPINHIVRENCLKVSGVCVSLCIREHVHVCVYECLRLC